MNTIEILVKALRKCAEAHKVEFLDNRMDDYNSVAIKSVTVPVVADVRTIVSACGGSMDDINTDWGMTEVDFDFIPMDYPVNMEYLKTALPVGTEI